MSGNISKTYTLKQASDLLGVTYRTVRYYKDIYSNEVHQDGRHIEVTERFIELVRNNRNVNKNRITDKKTKKDYRKDLLGLQDQLEKERKKHQEEIAELKKQIEKFEGLDYDLDNERIEVFTIAEYDQLEKALQEWKIQKIKLQSQEENFKIQMSSKDELVTHYRNQFDYQKKHADRILDQMEKLIEAIRRRDTIEAVEKNVIGKNIDLK